MTQMLTDRPALLRNRRRALTSPALFLHQEAMAEVKDRLSLVNKSFTDACVIGGFPEVWDTEFPNAIHLSDEDIIDLQPKSQDLIIHAMALHWAADPVGQLIQARRSLRPDGLFLGVFLGGGTLNELRSALAQAEADLTGGLSPRILPMAEIRDLGGLLQRAGFALPVADVVPLTATYETPLKLMHDLRQMGENNAMTARPRRFMRRGVLDRAIKIYSETFQTPDGRIPASFELMVLTGWAPSPDQQKPLRPGSASQRLAQALGTSETAVKD
ncbi:SAM-dependent methyltransferase [Roseovarius sp. EL26]|uniref:SAM-dependent methyltransferase n=1 Tax=Roseovarius sp. EL26 TaxID=2126672 RepID=UPI000EA2736B|nr:SAM-dependent methyltransferase [Roseovarius sp. EL26]